MSKWFILDQKEYCTEEYWILLPEDIVNKIKNILKKHNINENLWQKYALEALEKLAGGELEKAERIHFEIYKILLEKSFELLPIEICDSSYKVLTDNGQLLDIEVLHDGTFKVESIGKVVTSTKKISFVPAETFINTIKKAPLLKRKLPEYVEPLEILNIIEKAKKENITIKIFPKEQI